MNIAHAPLILPFRGITPKIHPTAFIAPGAVIIGDVEIGAECSIWFGCVLRGDVNKIRIGVRTNLQDGSVVHVAAEDGGANIEHAPTKGGTFIGNDITIGHMALLHECTLEDHAFIGMKSSVMDGAKVESYGVLAAGAMLTPNKTILEGQLWAGSPAKFWRVPEKEERDLFASRAGQYVTLSRMYLAEQSVR